MLRRRRDGKRRNKYGSEQAVQEAGKASGGFSVDAVLPGIVTLIISGIIIYIILWKEKKRL